MLCTFVLFCPKTGGGPQQLCSPNLCLCTTPATTSAMPGALAAPTSCPPIYPILLLVSIHLHCTSNSAMSGALAAPTSCPPTYPILNLVSIHLHCTSNLAMSGGLVVPTSCPPTYPILNLVGIHLHCRNTSNSAKSGELLVLISYTYLPNKSKCGMR